MSQTTRDVRPEWEAIPAELVALRERVQAQPSAVREALGPLVDDVVEDLQFRQRVLTVARDALEKFRLDLELARFDLDATRREHQSLLLRLAGRG